MGNKYPYIRTIKPSEFADFLNAKGGNADTFKCPICGNEHQTLIDNTPIDDNKSTSHIVLQPVLPAFVYPNGLQLKNAIDQKEYPEMQSLFLKTKLFPLGTFCSHGLLQAPIPFPHSQSFPV